MNIKLFDSELKIMEVLWEKDRISAKSLSQLLGESIGWNKNTTYTVIKKCIEKGAVARTEPGFICQALVTKEQVQQAELTELTNKLFDGSKAMLFAALIGEKTVPKELIDSLRKAITEKE